MQVTTTTTKRIFCTEKQILSEKRFTKLRNSLVAGQPKYLNAISKKRVQKAIENMTIRDFLTCDPDYIRFEEMNADNERNSVSFEELTINGIQYIYSKSSLPEIAQTMLNAFFDKDFEGSFNSNGKSTWQGFYSLPYGIAYRGGSGYNYTIWEYIKK